MFLYESIFLKFGLLVMSVFNPKQFNCPFHQCQPFFPFLKVIRDNKFQQSKVAQHVERCDLYNSKLRQGMSTTHKDCFRHEKINWCQKAKKLDKVLSNAKKRHKEGCQK